MNQRIKNPDLKPIQSDPRIDSPTIKVIYPSHDEPVIEPITVQTMREQAKVKEEVKSEVTQPTTNEVHSCTLSFQEAIKQHYIGFTLLGLGVLTLGFLLGKNKA